MIRLPGQRVARPRKHALDAVEIVAGGEVVIGNERFALDAIADADMAFEFFFHHTISPLTADAMHSSIEASAGA